MTKPFASSGTSSSVRLATTVAGGNNDAVTSDAVNTAIAQVNTTVTNVNNTVTGLNNTVTGLNNLYAPISVMSEADQWRITESQVFGINVSGGHLSQFWERVDTDGFARKGTGLTQNSGTFSFPSTGLYLITYNFFATCNDNLLWWGIQLRTTTNNSAYNVAAITYEAGSDGNGALGSVHGTFIFNVTNTTNCKFRLYYQNQMNMTIGGNSNENQNCVTVLKLG